jgi:hypothetical protein
MPKLYEMANQLEFGPFDQEAAAVPAANAGAAAAIMAAADSASVDVAVAAGPEDPEASNGQRQGNVY